MNDDALRSDAEPRREVEPERDAVPQRERSDVERDLATRRSRDGWPEH